MDKRITLNKVIRPNSIRYFLKRASIIVNSIRFILPIKNAFICKINNKELFFAAQDDGCSWQEVIYPEWDEYEKYYYFDLKFYKDYKICNIDIDINYNEDINNDVYIEFDSEYKLLYKSSSEFRPYNDFESISEKKYYVMIYNGMKIDDEPIDADLKYVNDNDNFKIKKIKNDLYELILYEETVIDSLTWDTTDSEKNNQPIYCILSELPIINFPIQFKNKDFFKENKF
jgi:hypothetical protein